MKPVDLARLLLGRGATPEGRAPAHVVRVGLDGGPTFDVVVKRQPGARRLTLRVSPRGEVILAAPRRVSMQDAARFAQSHVAWIAGRASALPAPVPFAPGAVLPVRGVDHVVEHRPGRGVVWLEDPREPCSDPRPRLCVAGDAAHVSRRILDSLRSWALQDLTEATLRHCCTLGVAKPTIQIRDPVSRWGSCSASGAISFSWRLILAPVFVLDYLAAHEATHLIHMNHSPAYWKTLGSLSADVDRAEQWLKAHGAGLHRYGRQPLD